MELRLGKTALKEGWNITRFEELEEKLGDMYLSLLREIRLLSDDNTDSNVSRQKVCDFWEKATQVMRKVFAESINGQLAGRIIEVCREQKKKEYRDLICGLASSYALVNNLPVSEMEGILNVLNREVIYHLKHCKDKAERSYTKAEKRYIFITPEYNQKKLAVC